MTDTPWTPGPWLVIASRQEDAIKILASGNPLKIAGRTNRASTNRAVLSAAPEMAELLASWLEPWNGFDEIQTQRRCDPATWKRIKIGRALLARIRGAKP